MSQELNEANYKVKSRGVGLFRTRYRLIHNSPEGNKRLASARLSLLAYALGYENLALQNSFSQQTGLPKPFIRRLVQRDLEGRV